MRNRIWCGFAAAAVMASCAGLAQAQTAPLPTRNVVYQLDSGVLANTGAGGAAPVFFRQIRVAGAPWLRLNFDQVVLSGDPNAGTGSYIQITSVKDGQVQQLDARQLEDWSSSSAYFNGDTVIVEVYAYAGTGTNRVTMSHVLAGIEGGFGPAESICGVDDRVSSSDDRQGRILPVGCTGWLISNGSCANRFLTAGHCMSAGGTGLVVEFNVPLSSSTGALNHPPVADQFPVIPASIQSTGNAGIGVDAAQFFTAANNLGEHARNHMGGAAYTLAAAAPAGAGLDIRITGYGTDSQPTLTQTQQTSTGPSVAKVGTNIRYTVDTEGGNSGSPVVTTANGLAIGIHTHAGCDAGGGFNNGTAVEFATLQNFLANPLGPCAPLTGPVIAKGAPFGEGGFGDHFGRANGPLGNGWSGASLANFSISGSTGTHTNNATESIQNDTYQGSHRSAVMSLNVFTNGTALQFAGVAGGMGGSDFFYVKLQAQTSTGKFSNIGFYRSSNGPWAGGAPFAALSSEFDKGRMRVSVSPDGDTVSCDIDTNFDGTPDQHYESSGLNGIAGNFGTKFGLVAFGAPVYDNFNVTHEGKTDNFDRANGGMSGPWAASAGTFANFSISGDAGAHANASSDIMRTTAATGAATAFTQWVDARAGAGLSFVGLCAGLGGTDNLFVKVQGTAEFSTIGFYHGNNGGAWAGMTGGAGFFGASANFTSARLRVGISADGDTAYLDVDTDFDGVADQSYARGGLNGISGSFGNQFGVTAYGDSTFDNYALLNNTGDTFNRANGPIGGKWAAVTGPLGAFTINGNAGDYTGGATPGTIMNTGWKAAITDSSQWLDVSLDPGGGVAFVSLLAGLGGTDNVFVKIQNNGGVSDFDRVFFYHGPTGGAGWTGMNPATIFNDLVTPVTSARVRLQVGADGDTVTLQVDNNFDGIADESFSRTGLSNITGAFGNRYGIGAYGPVGFDNWKGTPGTPEAAVCYPDCNGDGVLNLADFGCFTTKFALGDPYADCNGDGVRNLADFGCFQTKFALGCP
ncbi:MAG: hypothetical protein IT437_12780 [Phycisphaerales bacterium]|nr:hypothetical protein [Phycisphaerales bacterium]